MFRNQYDNDVTVFSPQGRLFQVEYALEAVKQGAPCVGIATTRHAVLAGLKRSPGDLSASATRKLFPLATHVGAAIAGLTSDARVLTRAMQKEAMGQRLDMERKVPVGRLVREIAAEKAQQATQYYGGRPFGVGLLVVGCDSTGAHLFEFSPAGSCLEYTGTAIGARSQSARTYLEGCIVGHAEDLGTAEGQDTDVNKLEGMERDELVRHALCALRECLPPDQALSVSNVSVGHVSVDSDFVIFSDEQVGVFLEQLPPAPQRSTASIQPSEMQATSNSGAEAMQD